MQNAEAASKSSHEAEPVLPDTTMPPVIPEGSPPPRDPRTGARGVLSRDPRLKGKQPPDRLSASHMPHSTSSHTVAPHGPDIFIPPVVGPAVIPPHGPAMIAPHGTPVIPPHGPPVQPFAQGPFPGQHVMGAVHPGVTGIPPKIGAPAEGHFIGEVYHPDSSGNSDRSQSDSSFKFKRDKAKVPHKEPAINRRDPRQARSKAEQAKHADDLGNARDNKDRFNRSSGRNSKERDRDPRRSRSPHSSSISPRSGNGARDSKPDLRAIDPRLKPRSNEDSRKPKDDSRKPNDRHEHSNDRRNKDEHRSADNSRVQSPMKHKRDNKRTSKDREKSPVAEKSPKYSKRTDISESKPEKTKPVKIEIKTEIKEENQTEARSTKEKSKSPSKDKVRNRNENAKKSGSVVKSESGEVPVGRVKTPKRELEKDDSGQGEVDENENTAKKPRIEIKQEIKQEPPAIVEGADVIGKIQEDIRWVVTHDLQNNSAQSSSKRNK